MVTIRIMQLENVKVSKKNCIVMNGAVMKMNTIAMENAGQKNCLNMDIAQ